MRGNINVVTDHLAVTDIFKGGIVAVCRHDQRTLWGRKCAVIRDLLACFIRTEPLLLQFAQHSVCLQRTDEFAEFCTQPFSIICFGKAVRKIETVYVFRDISNTGIPLIDNIPYNRFVRWKSVDIPGGKGRQQIALIIVVGRLCVGECVADQQIKVCSGLNADPFLPQLLNRRVAVVRRRRLRLEHGKNRATRVVWVGEINAFPAFLCYADPGGSEIRFACLDCGQDTVKIQ